MRAVNLIPSEQRSGGTVGARSGGAVFLVLGLLAGFVVLAVLYGTAHKTLASRTAEAATISQRAEQVKQQAAALAPYAAFMSLREQRLHSIAQLVAGRFDWATVMDELSRVLPSDASLTSIQGTVGASTATPAAPASAASGAASASASVASSTPPGATPTLTLAGCAKSQSTVAAMLVHLRLMNGVSNITLQSSTKSGSGSGSGSGSCPGSDPVFAVQVSFEPLPTAATPSVQQLTSDGSVSHPGASAAGTSNTGAKATAAAGSAASARSNTADTKGLAR